MNAGAPSFFLFAFLGICFDAEKQIAPVNSFIQKASNLIKGDWEKTAFEEK